MPRRSFFFIFLLIFLHSHPTAAQQTASPTVPNAAVDKDRLEVGEDLSESLANDLLELSVATRDGDELKTREYFPAQIKTHPFPSEPGPIHHEVKWIQKHAWIASPPATPESTTVTREVFLADWFKFLGHFDAIEDARFKVKESNFDASSQSVKNAKEPTAVVGATGNARLAFFVVGRDPQQRREWARGVAKVAMRYEENKHWQIQSFELVSLESMVATTDIFSEVSSPAGVAATLPSFGAAGNDSFTWHGGVAADFDNDGWIDLFVTGPDRNYLYLNDRHGHFTDVSEQVGLDKVSPGVAPVAFDFDNDGDLDIFISSVGAQILLENRLVPDGKLYLRDVSAKAGVAAQAVGFSVAVGDVNGDGTPDIYVTSYNHYGKVVPDSWYRATNGTRNLLFINQGNGTFKEEAVHWGVDDPRWSYAAEFADVNGDGKLDLYVVNDFGEKALYINKGDRFVDEGAARGVLDPGNGMGVSFGDFNNDGLLDLHVSNMSSTAGNRILTRLFPTTTPQDNVFKKLAAGNTLFQNLGNGKFRDVSSEMGGFSAGWAWGGGFIDFDNDGWSDLYTPTGFISGKSMKDT
jgi:hypothetical protein